MRGKCPNCLHDVYFTEAEVGVPDSSGTWGDHRFEGRGSLEKVQVDFYQCPNCDHLVVFSEVTIKGKVEKRLVWPLSALRLVPPEVPTHIKEDYLESANVLSTSAKASAALSRRCLQMVLMDAGGAKKKDLWDQIDEVLPHLPSHLAQIVDAIRAVGNFAAHPTKSKSSREIVEVEPGEAEFNLDVLDGLLDFYYVQPERTKQRKAAINKKLSEAGKPSLK